MIRTTETRSGLLASVLTALCCAATLPAHAAEDKFDGNWHFGVTPYLWLPYIDGTVNYDWAAVAAFQRPGRPGQLSAEPRLRRHAHRRSAQGRVVGLHRLHLSALDQQPIARPLRHRPDRKRARSRSTLPGRRTSSRTCGRSPAATPPGAGRRHSSTYSRDRASSNFDSTIGWHFATPVGALPPGGSFSQTLNKWDGIVGFKGQVRFGDGNWFMPYYADIGTGSNNWTWQAYLGVAYRFGWGELSLRDAQPHLLLRRRQTRPAPDRTRAGRDVRVLNRSGIRDSTRRLRTPATFSTRSAMGVSSRTSTVRRSR